MLSIAGATKIQMEEILYDLGYSKCGEEPSTLDDQVPIIIFDKKRRARKPKVKKINKKTLKSKNDKVKNFNKKTLKSKTHKEKKPSKIQNKEKLPDPLSPFAILKSIKIKK